MEKTAKQTISLPKEAKNIRTCVVGEELQVSYEIEVKMEVEESQNQEARFKEIKGQKEWLDKYFPIVPASTLSLDDEILKHKPETDNQNDFKERLEEAIKSGLQDFRAQIMDPSLDENNNICYKAGMMPALGKSIGWWKEKAEKFLPEKGSRLGLTEERIAFLALLMKELIEKYNYTISDAWRAVCDNSKDLGNYSDSKNSKHGLELTGSRQVGRWYDLGNDYKITIYKAGGLSLMGGAWSDDGINCPLTDITWFLYFDDFFPYNSDSNRKFSVGWLVLSV